jgi:hypothetical protein
VRPLLERRPSFPRLAPAAIVARLRPAAIVSRLAPVVVVSRRRPVVMSLAALGVLGVLLLFVVSALSRPGRDPMLDAAPVAQPRPTAAAVAQPRPAAAVAPCGDLNARSERTRELMARGDLRGALAVADEGLTNPTPVGCAAAHLELARLWYAADVDDMLATSVADQAQVRAAPARWVAIERRAAQLGLPGDERRPAMALAQTAYDRGLWQLADAAFRDAWAVGYAGAEGVEFRHALLRNWGYELAFKGTAAEAPRGLAMLKTAHVVSKAHDLKTDVACTDLRALGVADCASVTADPEEPTLLGPRRAGAP